MFTSPICRQRIKCENHWKTEIICIHIQFLIVMRLRCFCQNRQYKIYGLHRSNVFARLSLPYVDLTNLFAKKNFHSHWSAQIDQSVHIDTNVMTSCFCVCVCVCALYLKNSFDAILAVVLARRQRWKLRRYSELVQICSHFQMNKVRCDLVFLRWLAVKIPIAWMRVRTSEHPLDSVSCTDSTNFRRDVRAHMNCSRTKTSITEKISKCQSEMKTACHANRHKEKHQTQTLTLHILSVERLIQRMHWRAREEEGTQRLNWENESA